MKEFERINIAYNSVFKPQQLSLGVVVPIEHYPASPVPNMKHHVERVQLIERLGFKALWVRDIPFNVPAFGDAGQTFDPFTYLGYLAAQTNEIALAVGSIALPLHHPVHVAKSAATIDQLSEGRLILGVASGDRHEEYPGLGIDYQTRGELFRESFAYIRKAQEGFPTLETKYCGSLNGQVDVLPKATGHKIPLLITGYSRQTLEWNVQNADGWMSYPKNLAQQQATIAQWRNLIAKTQAFDKPFMQPLYIDLHENDDFKPQMIHLGFRLGANYLIDYLHHLQGIGVNHLAFNMRFNTRPIEASLEALASKVLPHFHSSKSESIPL